MKIIMSLLNFAEVYAFLEFMNYPSNISIPGVTNIHSVIIPGK